MSKFVTALVVVLASSSVISAELPTATDVAVDIYHSCLSEWSTSCVKPKALQWISEAVKLNEFKVTEDLSIVRTGQDEPVDFNQQRSEDNPMIELFDKFDSFLTSHSLRLNAPKALQSEEARSLIPESYRADGLAVGLQIPLVAGNVAEGRGFVKKVMIPFLLGLKIKATVLVPLAIALIAMKTWKALTLGLLSLVLSAAMVIFKLAKPKVVNYEVVHYPHHHDVHHDVHHDLHHHHVDHLDHHLHPAWEAAAWARSMGDAQEMAYNGQL